MKSRTKQTLLDSKMHLLFAVMDFSMRSCGAALTEGLRKCEAPSRTESLALLTPCFRKVVKIWWRPHLHQVSSLCGFICWQLNDPRHQQRSPRQPWPNNDIVQGLRRNYQVGRTDGKMAGLNCSTCSLRLCTPLTHSAPEKSFKNRDIMYRLS